jgi:NADPH:quinone reductase-like Zn-dependent oxidoreductase
VKHALVIGGTGMLSKVSIWLAANGYHVSVIGRNQEKMQRLLSSAESYSHMTPVLVDYTNNEELAKQLRQIQKLNGNIDLVVAWVHANGENVIPCLTKCISNAEQWKLFHVNGSSAKLDNIKKKMDVPKNVQYHQIQLGFILENGNSRWLLHDEISNGVIQAITEGEIKTIIGTIEPWDKRP